jgi:phosphatidylserine decarboxylase
MKKARRYIPSLYELRTRYILTSQTNVKTGQGYLTATATRAIIFFEADNKDLGLVCFLGIGMTEVSTCDITVKEGQHVKKGDEIGMFHYGGSTHCVLFRKGVELDEFPSTNEPQQNVPVRSKLAVVKKSS